MSSNYLGNWHECPDGHLIVWDECPFCCVLKNQKPQIKDEMFHNIYNHIKGLPLNEINDVYSRYKYIVMSPDGPGTEGNRFSD